MNITNLTNATSMSNNDSCTIEYHSESYYFFCVYIIIMPISIPTNLLSLYVSYKHIQRKNELGVFLFNLSLSDLLYTMTLPIWLDFVWTDKWKHGEYVCKVSVFLMYTNVYSSTAFLGCISINRYLAVVYPLRFLFFKKVKSAVYISIVIWAIELVFNSLVLFFEETYVEYDSIPICFDIYPLPRLRAKFEVIRFFAGFLFTSVLIIFCCQRIYKAVKSNKATVDQEKKRISKLLCGITIIFLICFGPLHVIMIVRSILEPNSCDFANILSHPYKIVLGLSAFNCIADPFLYCFVSKTARKDVLSTVSFFKKNKNIAGPELEFLPQNTK